MATVAELEARIEELESVVDELAARVEEVAVPAGFVPLTIETENDNG
jgi:hypothetical protein